MAEYVINEWLWADLRGVNGQDRRLETIRALQGFVASDNSIVILACSPFDSKAWALCKDHDETAQRLGAYFVTKIRQDFTKCRIIEADSIPAFPTELEDRVKIDDRYLVQTQLAAPGSIIVTTDAPLMEVLAQSGYAHEKRTKFVTRFSQS